LPPGGETAAGGDTHGREHLRGPGGRSWHVACLLWNTMRATSKYRRWLFCAWLACASAPALAEPQDVGQLESLARSEAALHLPQLTQNQRFVAGPIDPHFKLESCAAPIKAVVGPGGHMRDRILVELRCSAPNGWHLYVPVRVVGTSIVTIAARAIVAGTVLTEKDVRSEKRDISELPPGYLDDPSVAIGLTASRPIASGAVVTNQILLGAKAVQRGQSVTLVADASGMSVRMAGRALTDGLINQRVKVQNLSSGKVVEGIARSEQVVEIILQ
jgi:flagellar basal body P-ring formation protein FlgA